MNKFVPASSQLSDRHGSRIYERHQQRRAGMVLVVVLVTVIVVAGLLANLVRSSQMFASQNRIELARLQLQIAVEDLLAISLVQARAGEVDSAARTWLIPSDDWDLAESGELTVRTIELPTGSRELQVTGRLLRDSQPIQQLTRSIKYRHQPAE